MRWVRPNIRFGAWCALFALAVQFLVLASHFHRFDPGLITGSVVGFGSAAGVDARVVKPAKPASSAMESCALCAVINKALPSAAPSAIRPPIVGTLRFRIELSFLAPPSPRRIFSARAPPLA
jgi:hypothetical protein